MLLLIVLLIISYSYFLHKRKFSVFSCVDFFVIFYTLVIILTILYHFFYPKYLKINFYNFDLNNLTKFDINILIFIKWLVYFLIGHSVFKITNKKYQTIISKKIIFNFKEFFKPEVAFKISTFLIIISCILVLLDYGYGLIFRTQYIPYESSYFKLIYNLLFLGASFLCGSYFKHNKFFYGFIISLILIFNLSIGTRLASINLVVIVFTYIINSNKVKIVQILTSTIFVVLFFGLNLSLRSEAYNHGLIPYFQIIFQKPEIILKYAIENLYYTFVFGFYATVETVKEYNEYQFNHLFISLNPLTGGLAKWYLIVDKMKLNIFAPFTGIGILSKHNYFFFIFTTFIGYFFSFIDNIIKENIINKKYIQPLILLLFCALFSILIFEYNLRNASRYLYYSLFIIFIFKFRIRNGKVYFRL
jgi:hypothetical protein